MLLVTLFAALIVPTIPAGEHDLYVWHERLDQLRAHATVPSNGTASVTFEFRQDGIDYGRSTNK